MAVEDEVAFTVGVILTVRSTVPVRVHPAVLVPAAEYVVVEPGVTVITAPVIEPGDQV
jgi:hypothetical protein